MRAPADSGSFNLNFARKVQRGSANSFVDNGFALVTAARRTLRFLEGRFDRRNSRIINAEWREEDGQDRKVARQGEGQGEEPVGLQAGSKLLINKGARWSEIFILDFPPGAITIKDTERSELRDSLVNCFF